MQRVYAEKNIGPSISVFSGEGRAREVMATFVGEKELIALTGMDFETFNRVSQEAYLLALANTQVAEITGDTRWL